MADGLSHALQLVSLRIHRPLIPMPYRTAEEMKKSEEVAWEGAWLSFSSLSAFVEALH